MPRIITAERPSSSRSFCCFEGSSRRETKGGRTRTVAGTSTLLCRAMSPRTLVVRRVTRSAARAPRRLGESTVVISRVPCGGRVRRVLVSCAPALGGHASRTRSRIGRSESLTSVSVDRVSSPRRTIGPGVRCRRTSAGEGAANRSMTARTTMTPAVIARLCQPGASMTGTIPETVRRSRRGVIQRGTSVVATIESRTWETLRPSICASGRRMTRWPSVIGTRNFTSSGVT